MAIKVQLRNDTSAAWSAANPVLMQGEIGIDRDSGRIKIGNGVTAWNALPFALTGPEGPQGSAGLGAMLTGPAPVCYVGQSLEFTLSAYDSYAQYAVSAINGTATITGDKITYQASGIDGDDTLTISVDGSPRTITIAVLKAVTTFPPAPPPAIGEAHEGGFFTGVFWDTVCAATGETSIATGVKTLTIDSAFYPFYAGQEIKLAPANNTTQVFMRGIVVERNNTQITLNITSVTGSGTFSSWVIAARWKLITMPKAQGEHPGLAWKTSNSFGPVQTQTLTNGVAATAAMAALNTPTLQYPLAGWIANLNSTGGINGYTDLYIPARDEQELQWRNLKPNTSNNTITRASAAIDYVRDANTDDTGFELNGENKHSDPIGAGYTSTVPAQTAATAFRVGEAEELSGTYWSSSEISSSGAWFQVFGTSSAGAQSYASNNKNSLNRARAVRRSIL
jgi:hypothetical protein